MFTVAKYPFRHLAIKSNLMHGVYWFRLFVPFKNTPFFINHVFYSSENMVKTPFDYFFGSKL